MAYLVPRHHAERNCRDSITFLRQCHAAIIAKRLKMKTGNFSGISLLYVSGLYVSGSQSDGNEEPARTDGAHYYVSKPPLERFGRVLQSFLQAQQVKG